MPAETYVKDVNCISWAIKREGEPKIQVRAIRNWDKKKEFQVIIQHYPFPSTLETWKWLLNRRIETPENCAKLGRALIKLAESFETVEDVLLNQKNISINDYNKIKKDKQNEP